MPTSSSTPLREYYDALHTLTEHEQTVLAETHAADPKLLLRRFERSLRAFRAPINEPFYATTRSDPAEHQSPVDEITTTIGFAAQISNGEPRPVDSIPKLAFRCVDRELSPLRTTGSNRPARRSLDLMLANADDGVPIFAELKIGTDKSTYFALVQLLALAADFLPPAQRQRLEQHTGTSQLRWPEAGPYADLYIITLNPPAIGAYRARALAATQQIVEQLLDDGEFSNKIRRIAYLEAVPKDGALAFHARFAYGDGL
jgi:hypothetical protein